MKKLIILTVLFFSLTVGVKAQMVVEDPVNAGINASIAALSESSVALQTFISNMKVLELAASGIQTMNSVKEIAKLVDDLVCLTTEFNFYMNISGTYNCAKFLNFRLININLSYTTEILTNVLLSKNVFTMSSAERLNNLNRIKDVLEKTIKDMVEINSTIKGIVIQDAYRKHIKKTYTAEAKRTMSFNRYEKR